MEGGEFMSTLAEIVTQRPPTEEQPSPTRFPEEVHRETVSPADSIRNEQIQTLVQQLFFRLDSPPLRHVGLAPVEAQAETAALCLQAARVLAEQGTHDVALVDAGLSPVPLHTELGIEPPAHCQETPWVIAPRLWLVPRQSWLGDTPPQRVSHLHLAHLRDLTHEFDFSILCCAPVSGFTTRIGHSCDGLVLVVTANKTRRLVAAQIKEQLQKARIPLLGIVLTERRFPIPQGLYRSL